MTLLDSNARLALQLQALGKDLQTVYRRFKALESSIGLLAAEKKPGNYSNARLHRKGTPGATDVQPIIMQMQKWGRDLQTAAETLSLSRA
jgi:DNA-binding HxlR family transcriptional regulator